MKKIAAIFFVLAMAFSVLAGYPVHASGAATLTLSPTNVSVDTGEEFTISVLVNPNGESIDTIRVNLSFPPAMVEALWFDLGSQFSSLSPGYELDNVNGELSFGAFKYGEPVTTAGTAASVTFRALSGGTATITVEDDSKLISEGEEKINKAANGSVSAAITGEAVASTEPAPEPEPEVFVPPTTGTPEEQALVYFGALVGRMPSSSEDWDALHCMAYDICKPATQDATREGKALEVFGAKYARLPATSLEWYVLHAIAYTDIVIDWSAMGYTETVEPAEEEPAAEVEEEAPAAEPTGTPEEQALVYFGALVGRLPSSSEDWDALHCMAYDVCKPETQDPTRESMSLEVFGAKYARMPSTSMEWYVLHAIAYTNIVIDWDEAEEEEAAEAEEVDEEEEVEEPAETAEEDAEDDMLTEDEAIGVFGQIYARLPSSSADWDAVHIMVDGYSGEKDTEAESAALVVYTEVFAELPTSSSDWNVLAAIAYSGAVR